MAPLISHRVVIADDLGARIATHALLHSRYRIHAVHNENVVSEDALALGPFDRQGHLARPILTVLLQGTARISAHGKTAWLAPGDVVAMDSKAPIVMRQEGAPYMAIAFEWDDGGLGARPAAFTRGTLGATELRAAHGIWNDIVEGSADARTAVSLSSVVGLGLDLRPGEALDEDPLETHVRLSLALDACFSNLRVQPMIADLERDLALSTRHLNRLVLDFNTKYGFNATGWRDARNRRRLLVGASLMTSPGATAEGVAREVGYQSLSAFTKALTDAGFPPPSAIAARVAALRDGPSPLTRESAPERSERP